MTDINLETSMGCTSDRFRLAIVWFDHDNVHRVSVVQARILDQDKPRTLVVEAATVDGGRHAAVEPDDIAVEEVYRVEGGCDAHAMRPINIKVNPAFRDLVEEKEGVELELEKVRALLVKTVRCWVNGGSKGFPFLPNSDDIAADHDLVDDVRPNVGYCKRCRGVVSAARLRGSDDIFFYWCQQEECGHHLAGQWMVGTSAVPDWLSVDQFTRLGDLKPGQRFRLGAHRYLVPYKSDVVARNLASIPHCSENTVLVGRDTADPDRSLRESLTLELMDPQTVVDVIE